MCSSDLIIILFEGMHYWYNLTKSMSCDEMFSMLLRYNSSGQLNAFGWDFDPKYDSSSLWEHPKPSQLGVSPSLILTTAPAAIKVLMDWYKVEI